MRHRPTADLDRKDAASRIAAEHAERTQLRRAGRPGACDAALRAHFAQISQFGAERIATTTDGVGTKVELAERTRIYTTIAYDLVAMVVDDLAAAGADAVALTNVLDVDCIDVETVAALMRGLEAAAIAADVAVTGGEIAELGARIGGYGEGMHFNWCATAIGHYPGERPALTGKQLQPGQAIVGFSNVGFRSNGLTRVRHILEQQYGPEWHDAAAHGSTWGQVALAASTIYAPTVTALFEKQIPVFGAAHITGGGIPNKLGRMLRGARLGAHLETPLAPCPAMLELQQLGKVSDIEAYSAWNMGQGFAVVTDDAHVAHVVGVAAERSIYAARIGIVTAAPEIRIQSRGSEGREIVWPQHAEVKLP
jgi:phosphoribosylformylglycinamidine cyclo-ligase